MFTAKPYGQILGKGMTIFIIILLIGSGQGKDHRCRRPVTKNCNASESYIDGWKYTGWYYHTEIRACRPLYTPNGWHTCPENYDLPMAREMCEDLCAEPCMRSNGAPGICMYNDICTISYSQKPPTYKPCNSDKLNCCVKEPDSGMKFLFEITYGKNEVVYKTIRKDINDPGYRQEGYGYIYSLPYQINNKGKR
ncbi:uncharacterized protein LOC113558132 [Rhopalosiphum maidis]|uniref:uncharacterized protein LOC113558132 n=1 Tax=Rhopalosiphum maidis TaxID=43146 RepID=UPI000F00D3B0|nr:uncharacterized protein LOC113558132 [Rhopalosiphum maidis]